MQTSLMKRNVMTLLESGPIDKSKFYQEPKKKLKANLKIEVSDSYIENYEPNPISTSRGKQTTFSFRNSFNLQTSKASTSSSPTLNERRASAFDFSKLFSENNTIYDNFNKEDEFFSITMKKCHRRNMEDRAVFEAHSETPFFGIYDGHRNSYASEYLQRNLHKTVLSHPEMAIYPEKAMRETFFKIDQEVCRNQEKLNIQGGSTALCALFQSDGLCLANVGDSKAVVIRGGEPLNLNKEHRANNEEEKKQVENRGGFIFEKKGQTSSRFLVQGALELTRSIGDNSYKQYITSEPDVLQYKFDMDDEYIVLASDGLWNELNEDKVTKLINGYAGTQGMSKLLVEEATKGKHYNVDNITVIVIDVKKYLKNKARMSV